MLRYIVRRILISIPVLVVASFLCFALVSSMGDPLGEWKASKPRLPTEVAAEEHIVGYDQPFFERYGSWAVHFVQGDWNRDVAPGHDTFAVRPTVMSALWVTVKLVLFAELLALLIGIIVGVIGAVRQYSAFDYSVTGIAFTLFSMPLFCIAIMLKAGGIQFNNWLQSVGMGRWITTAGPPPGGFAGGLGHQIFQYTGAYILPVLCLLAFSFALIPVVTVAALNIGAVFSGAVVTETVFAWNGMGALIVKSVNGLEPWMVLGWLVVTAIFIIVFNLIADILYGFLDPRIRLD